MLSRYLDVKVNASTVSARLLSEYCLAIVEASVEAYCTTCAIFMELKVQHYNQLWTSIIDVGTHHILKQRSRRRICVYAQPEEHSQLSYTQNECT